MKKLFKGVTLFLFICVAITSLVYGNSIKGIYQLEIYKTLLTISSIVFAVMGAWLSLLKVEIIQGIESAKTDQESIDNVEKARRLISPMSSSVVIIALCLLFVFLYYSLLENTFIHDNNEIFRRVSFFILASLTFWQMTDLLKVMFSGVDFLIGVSRMSKDLSGDRKR